jgi:AcrR family transcriptional regulator
MNDRRKDLNREDWLNAGQATLRDEGLRALKLRPLTASLGVSTGSFYHHFSDFDAYLDALADHYAGGGLTDTLQDIRGSAPTPIRRILLASDLALSQDLPRLAMAMRAWGRSHDGARASVEKVDALLTRFFADCLEEMGLEPLPALARAWLLVASATSDMPPPTGLPAGLNLRDLMLEIVVGGEN